MTIIQYLLQDGSLNESAPAIKTERLLKYYQSMVEVRTFDYKAIALQRTGKMGTYPSVLGHESTSAAIGMNMQDDDVLAPYYRDQVTQYLRGVSFKETLLYWGGDERGNNFQVAKHDFPWSVPIASQTLHAVGAGFALKYQKKKSCVVTTLGDGATSEGDFYEAINAAGAMELPIVFVIYNNKWAISTPLSKQTSCETLAQKATAGGMPGVQVDGNDVFALDETLKKACERARLESLPMVVEALTYRLGDHTTADDASRYRTKDELDDAWDKDGILRLEKYLLSQNILSKSAIEEIKNQAKELVEKSVNEYLDTPAQSKADLFDYHYADIPQSLKMQKQECENA